MYHHILESLKSLCITFLSGFFLHFLHPSHLISIPLRLLYLILVCITNINNRKWSEEIMKNSLLKITMKEHDDSGIFVIPFFIPNFLNHSIIIYRYNSQGIYFAGVWLVCSNKECMIIPHFLHFKYHFYIKQTITNILYVLIL